VLERPIKRNAKELERIVSEERDVRKSCGGYLAFVGPFKPELAKGYTLSKITGLPRHSKRAEKSKVLRPGLYFHIPVIDHIVIDYKQEKVLNLENISIPTVGAHSKSMIISCNIRYELFDLYKAYTAVHDYERSLKDYTLSILAVYSRGKKYDNWKDPKVISCLEKQVAEELRKLVTEKWGLKIHRVYITDHVEGKVQRIMYEGAPMLIRDASAHEGNE
jgi:hypothetical protein